MKELSLSIMDCSYFYSLVSLYIIAEISSCKAVTDFCKQPLGMEHGIILDAQITESTTFGSFTHKGKEARLNNDRCWCSKTGTVITDQWVKVDLKKPMSITGIKIQGDPGWPKNYLTRFKLDYNYDNRTKFYNKIDNQLQVKEFVGANGENQLISRLFDAKPFTGRYIRLRPLQKSNDSKAYDVCARFELYGCSYVCKDGLGIEAGSALPSGFSLSASSAKTGKEAANGRLSGTSSWCANTNKNSEYLLTDFGKVMTLSGLAVQGDPTKNKWVKEFYIDYGTTLASLTAYEEDGSIKLIGNKDRNTIVVHWFQVRLTARFLKLWPTSYNGDKCLRMEVIGCDSEFVGELGAENRVLEDGRFSAYDHTDWWKLGRYQAKDGRLNNDRPWGKSKTNLSPWFKVDLGRIMLVNGISIQGDPVYGQNYFPDYKLEFGNDGSTMYFVKQERTSRNKVFNGNINNMGVKFNFLEKNPISARYLRFRENTKPLHDYTLRIEVYGRPQACAESFGMIAGEPMNSQTTIRVSGGLIPASKANINAGEAWCDINGLTSSVFFMYDFGAEREVSGLAIQGHPSENKWVKSFKVQFGLSSSSLHTYHVSGVDKQFIGSNSRNGIVYNWFTTAITTRYLKIIPMKVKNGVCLRLNVYGCPEKGCFKQVGIQSSAKVANSLLTSSTSNTGNEAYKGRLNFATTWSACQVGSCSPKEGAGKKPWIQLCLAKSQMISGVVIQGFGQVDDLALVSKFRMKYAYHKSGSFFDYKIQGATKIFSVSTGRYGSRQINFPLPFAAGCIRLIVQSQSLANKNVGLRWEILGCSPVSSKVAVSLISSLFTIRRSQVTTITCTATGQPGLTVSFSSSGSPVVDSDIHKVEAASVTNSDIVGVTTRALKITAIGQSISTSYSSCVVTDIGSGLVQCQRSFFCSAEYPRIFNSSGLKSFVVAVKGLLAKPPPPVGLSTINVTQTSAKVTWTAPSTVDFPLGSYNVSMKRKGDSASAGLDKTVTTLEATFLGLNPYTEYTVEISAKSASFNVYSEKKSHSFRTALKDTCLSRRPCKNNGKCLNQGNGKYHCNCTPGYTGKNCNASINECHSKPCSRNGKCVDEINSYRCTCNIGFTGKRCEIKIDPCKEINCNNGMCISNNESYLCHCYKGYTGRHCITDIDECSLQPKGVCNNGECIPGNGSITCKCFIGHLGNRCNIDKWPCRSNPCLNGGMCTNDLGSGFSCKCLDVFRGTRCERKLKPCDAKPCKNQGICKDLAKNGENWFDCGCKEGYGGKLCQYLYGDSAVLVTLKYENSQAFNETVFGLAIAKSLNDQCVKEPPSCPKITLKKKSVGISHASKAKQYLFKSSDIEILPGYPKSETADTLKVLFFVTMNPGNFSDNSSPETLVDTQLVKTALERKVGKSLYGFWVQTVRLASSMKKEVSQDSSVLRTFLIVVSALASIVLALLLFITGLCWQRRRMTNEWEKKQQKVTRTEENLELPAISPFRVQVNNAYIYENGTEKDGTGDQEACNYPEVETEITFHDSGYVYVKPEKIYESLS